MLISHTPNENTMGRFAPQKMIYVCAHAEKINCSTIIMDEIKRIGGFLLGTTFTRNAGMERGDFEFYFLPCVRFIDISALKHIAQTYGLYIHVFDIAEGEYKGTNEHITFDHLSAKPIDNTYVFKAQNCIHHTPIKTSDRVLTLRRYPNMFKSFVEGNFQLFNGVMNNDLRISDIEVREGLSLWTGLHPSGIWVYANSGKQLVALMQGKIERPQLMDVSTEVNYMLFKHCSSDSKIFDLDLNTRMTAYFIYRKLFKTVGLQMFREIMTNIPIERLQPLVYAWRGTVGQPQPSDDELLELIKKI